MRRPLVLISALASTFACASPSTPPPVAPPPGVATATAAPAASQAAKPDTVVRYDVVMMTRVAGNAVVTRHADGSYDEDFAYEDRGRGPKLHVRTVVGAASIPAAVEIAGHDYLHRAVKELATCGADRCAWDSTDERGDGPRAFYVPMHGGVHGDEVLLRAANAAGAPVPLLGGGSARAAKVAETTLERGAEKRHVVAWEIAGLGLEPSVSWFDDDGTLFGSVSDWSSIVREGWEDAIPKLLALEKPLGQARRQGIAKSVAHRPEKGLAIVHARLFDPEKKATRDDVTIVVDGGRVKSVTPKGAAPAGAEVIDATGKTVIPGLWDMHVHTGDDSGLLHLGHGVTSVRDLGNDADSTLARRARWDEGRELGPRVLVAGLVDGSGPYQGPTKLLVDDEKSARDTVAMLASKGYVQLKIYSSVKPELVPVLVAEAHKRGMRVSGHVPAKMIAEDAVNAGFDELQHVNFLVLDLVADRDTETRTPARFTVPAERAAGLDLDSPKSKALLDLLVKKRTVVDPTLSIFEGMLTIRRDHPDPTLAPILDRLPPQLRRSATSGGLPVPEGMDATYKESFKRCQQLVKRLWDRKVVIVAGTDSIPGLALHRELELYAEAGIPNADVLALATLGAAKVMSRDKDVGSVAPGKLADLVILDQDPLKDMRAIRTTRTVVKDGVVIDAPATLRALSIATP
jgi:imidazolonepropionase-like amidohydrolase